MTKQTGCTMPGPIEDKVFVGMILRYNSLGKYGTIELLNQPIKIDFQKRHLSAKSKNVLPLPKMWCVVRLTPKLELISVDVDYNNYSNPPNGETARGINHRDN